MTVLNYYLSIAIEQAVCTTLNFKLLNNAQTRVSEREIVQFQRFFRRKLFFSSCLTCTLLVLDSVSVLLAFGIGMLENMISCLLINNTLCHIRITLIACFLLTDPLSAIFKVFNLNTLIESFLN